LLGGTPDEVPERYAAASPAELAPLGVKQVLIHGVDDDIVPIAISEGYAARATAAGDDVTLIEIPNAEHFAVIDPESRAFARILSAVSSLVERPAEARGARGPGGWSSVATRPGAVPTRPAI
jgi:pimeloyl-ACP methyl ester carboxylesterase